MNKLLSILIIILLSFVGNFAIAGDDGKLKINGNKSNNGYEEVGDCFEKINRGVFAFNQALDKVIFKPLAKGYRMFPQPIRSGTSHALSNLGNVVTIPNNVLQGQFNPCYDDLYLSMKAKGLNALTSREYHYFTRKDEECSEYNTFDKKYHDIISRFCLSCF